MSELSFYEFETEVPKEVNQKALEERQKQNASVKSYADDKVLDSHTIGVKFDFDESKKLFIADLDWLSNLSVEEFTFRKKWEEMQLLNDYVGKADWVRQMKAMLWSPTDLENEELTIKEIENLQPRMVLADGEPLERTWTSLRYYCSTAEYNQAPGRFFKFLLVDDVSGKILGISSIASDVISISDRDKYIGWTKEDKLDHKMLKYSAIGTTIVPTQPFGTNFLGGKLMAAMVTSDIVRKTWETPSGEGIPCKLVGMTTTSLYGSTKGNVSMYSGLKWWKTVGMSKGKVPIKPYEDSYKEWHDWLKQHRKEAYDEAMTQKEGVKGPVTGAKMRVLNMIFKECGVKQSEYCHGFERGVYYSCFYENTKEFLSRKITEDKLVMKPLFKDDTKAILDWWRPKAIERYKKLKAEGRLNPHKLFYFEMTDMEYADAKSKYFDAVGR